MSTLKFLLFTAAITLAATGFAQEKQPQEIAQRIAQKAGLKEWQGIKSFDFRFKVERNGETLTNRMWSWNKVTNEVKLVTKDNTVQYKRGGKLTPSAEKTDKSFVNDSFWLLFPYKLLTDTGVTYSHKKAQTNPINGKEMDCLTVTYKGDGGYTPGDAYDVYYSSDYRIQAWSYRNKNAEKVNLSTSFEGYTNINGIELAEKHTTPDGNTTIYTTALNFRSKG